MGGKGVSDTTGWRRGEGWCSSLREVCKEIRGEFLRNHPISRAKFEEWRIRHLCQSWCLCLPLLSLPATGVHAYQMTSPPYCLIYCMHAVGTVFALEKTNIKARLLWRNPNFQQHARNTRPSAKNPAHWKQNLDLCTKQPKEPEHGCCSRVPLQRPLSVSCVYRMCAIVRVHVCVIACAIHIFL